MLNGRVFSRHGHDPTVRMHPHGGKGSRSFQFLVITTKPPSTFLHVILCERTSSFLLSKHLGVGLLSHVISVCLPLRETAKLSSRAAAPACIPTSRAEHPCQHLLVSVLHFCHSDRLRWYLILICNSPMKTDVERFFIKVISCRLYIITFGVVSIQVFCPFKNLGCFLFEF